MNWFKEYLINHCSREYKLNLPRKEVEEVDNLREEWTKLIELAEAVSMELGNFYCSF